MGDTLRRIPQEANAAMTGGKKKSHDHIVASRPNASLQHINSLRIGNGAASQVALFFAQNGRIGDSKEVLKGQVPLGMAWLSGFAISVLSTVQVVSTICPFQGFGQWHAGQILEVFVFLFPIIVIFLPQFKNPEKGLMGFTLLLHILGFCVFGWNFLIAKFLLRESLCGRFDVVACFQVVSKPLLVLSIATTFSDEAELFNRTSDGINNSDACSEVDSEASSECVNDSNLDTRIPDEFPQNVQPEMWLTQLHKELETQGITLPERIDEEELRRFYTAANGDFSCLLSSIKKTIKWRETYGILSVQELEMWSNMVFWHGFDVKHRPCLIVRLGLACTSLPSHDRPRFAQAIISQVEHGVFHLLDANNAQITVVVDCEGLSPLKIPMQVMRTCSSLLQDHFPNRLGCLFVIQLPPVLRVIAQTFIQVLKPYTRQKLRIEGEMYRKILSEYLETLPSYLGGKCMCKICSDISITDMQQPHANEMAMTEQRPNVREGGNPVTAHPTYEAEVDMDRNCDQVLRTAIVGILMIWVFIAFIAGFIDPESRPIFPK